MTWPPGGPWPPSHLTTVVAHRAGARAQRPVVVGVEFGEFAVDVDGTGAVDVHVLVVGRPDMCQEFVVDVVPAENAIWAVQAACSYS